MIFFGKIRQSQGFAIGPR